MSKLEIYDRFSRKNWRDKKESQEANAAISMFLRYGLTEDD